MKDQPYFIRVQNAITNLTPTIEIGQRTKAGAPT
jgi:hypothetical protein